MKTQHGYVFRKGNSWFLRHSDLFRQPDGTLKRKQVCKRLAEYGGEYRSEASVRRAFVENILAPINKGTVSPNSNMAVADFVEQIYFPHITEQVRPFTLKNYKHLWTRHLLPHIGKTTLRDFRTVHGVQIISEIARPMIFSKRFDTSKASCLRSSTRQRI